MTPRSERDVDGVLIVDKPAGPTSHDIVDVVRRALGTRRVGHAGTLDPFATGVLVICVGRATRLSSLFMAGDKTYEGVIRFGFATDTGDGTGRPLEPVVDAPELDMGELRRIVAGTLTGEIAQIPPMFSAKKKDGVALHRIARRGGDVERAAVLVRASDWGIEARQGSRAWFRVTCSAGTYVRVMASDLGERLGVGAHLESLRRVRSGSFGLEGAVPGDELGRDRALEALVPMDAVPLPVPDVVLAAGDLAAFAHGRRVASASCADERVAVRDGAGRLVGIARREGSEIVPEIVLARGP